MQYPKKLLKPACFIATFATIWFGPSNILGRTTYEEEKLHIAIGLIVSLIIIAQRLTPKHPNLVDPKKLSKKKQINLLKSQLKYQWHKLKENAPFDVKYAPIKLLIGQSDTGCKTLMQTLYRVKPEQELPFACELHHDKNSIIFQISPEIMPDVSAQHSKHLFQVIRKFIDNKCKQDNLAQAYLTISVNNIMQTEVTKYMDAYNYTLAAMTNDDTITPVKIIITKCDQIAGFVPYFEHSDQHTKDANFDLKFDSFDEIEFNQEYSRIVEQLNTQMIRRLHTEAQYYRRILIKDFPIQLEKLRPLILNNLQHLIKHDSWPINGVNLTSAVQNGSYVDLINQKIGMQDAVGTEKLMLASQRYFCDQLFNSPPLVYKARISVILTETWGQLILGLLALTTIMIANQFWWLQRFEDIKDFQLAKLEKPKLILEKDAGLWQKQHLQSGIQPWLSNNPIPKQYGNDIGKRSQQNITRELVTSIQKLADNCTGNTYLCLENKWSSFVSTQEISQRINWIKQHKSLFKKIDLTSNNLKSVRTDLVSKALDSKLETGKEVKWLTNLIETIEKNRILLPEYRSHNKSLQLTLQNPSNLKKLHQMQFALSNLADSNKIFAYLKNSNPVSTDMPNAVIELEKTLNKIIQPIITEHVNQVWQQSVYKHFQENLAEKFPFKETSKDDANIDKVKKLFQMKEFFKRYYSPIIRKVNLELDLASLNQLDSLEQFLGSNVRLRYSISPSSKLNSDVKIAELNIGGSLHNLEKNSIPMFSWPINGYDDTVSIWLQNKAGKMAMASRHGPWGIFRLIKIAGSFNPGDRASNLNFKLDEQVIRLTINFARPWAKLDINLPKTLV